MHFLVGLDDLNKYKIEDHLDLLLQSFHKYKITYDNKSIKLVLCFPDDFQIPKKYLKYNIFYFKKKSGNYFYRNAYYMIDYMDYLDKNNIVKDICIFEPDMIFIKDFDIPKINDINIWFETDFYKKDPILKLQNWIAKKENINYKYKYVWSGILIPKHKFYIFRRTFKQAKVLYNKYSKIIDKYIKVSTEEIVLNKNLEQPIFNKFIAYNTYRDSENIFMLHSKNIDLKRKYIEYKRD